MKRVFSSSLSITSRLPTIVSSASRRWVSTRSPFIYKHPRFHRHLSTTYPKIEIPSGAITSLSKLKYYPQTEVTRLSNGLRIATEPFVPSNLVTIAVVIETGTRFENEKNNGVAHFLEHMNFKGTTKRTRESLEKEIEVMGASLNAYTSRELQKFYIRGFKEDTEHMVELLSDILQNSTYKEELIQSERSTILREAESIENDHKEYVLDMLHEAAYRENPLGYNILGSHDHISNRLQRNDLIEFTKNHYIGPKMVLVASGNVDHKEFARLGEKYFSSLPSHPKQETKPVPKKFTGSDKRERDDRLDIAHIAYAFETEGANDPDSTTLSVLQQYFGPNYALDMPTARLSSSDLVSEVAKHNLAESFQFFFTSYADTGLFGIYTTCEPIGQQALFKAITHEFTNVCYEVNEPRLLEAKNILKKHVLKSAMESSEVTNDEICRQLIQHGRRIHPLEMIQRIDAVDVDAVKECANRYFYDRDFVLAGLGNLHELPDYNWFRRRTYFIRY